MKKSIKKHSWKKIYSKNSTFFLMDHIFQILLKWSWNSPKSPPDRMAVPIFITTTETMVMSKNVSCHWSVFTLIRTVLHAKNIKITTNEPTIRKCNRNLWPNIAFKIRNIVLGIDAEKLKSDVNVACIGVISVLELLVTLRNLYIQYWNMINNITTISNTVRTETWMKVAINEKMWI